MWQPIVVAVIVLAAALYAAWALVPAVRRRFPMRRADRVGGAGAPTAGGCGCGDGDKPCGPRP